jgi:DNA-binding response OmpR family regulator
MIQTEPFHALVSDIGLRDGSGYALVALAKREQRSILAIAISAYGSSEDILLGKVAGFDHHFVKPFDPYELRAVLESMKPAEAA